MLQMLWGLVLVFFILAMFVLNFCGMVYYSYQAINVPEHGLLYLIGAIWCTGACYYISSILSEIWVKAKEVVDTRK